MHLILAVALSLLPDPARLVHDSLPDPSGRVDPDVHAYFAHARGGRLAGARR